MEELSTLEGSRLGLVRVCDEDGAAEASARDGLIGEVRWSACAWGELEDVEASRRVRAVHLDVTTSVRSKQRVGDDECVRLVHAHLP